jgi:hypothetical protein
MTDDAAQAWKQSLSGWLTKRFLLAFTGRRFCALVGSQLYFSFFIPALSQRTNFAARLTLFSTSTSQQRSKSSTANSLRGS